MLGEEGEGRGKGGRRRREILIVGRDPFEIHAPEIRGRLFFVFFFLFSRGYVLVSRRSATLPLVAREISLLSLAACDNASLSRHLPDIRR